MDRYFASQYLSQEKRERDCCEEEDCARKGYHETWTDTADTHWFDTRDSPTNLCAGAESTEHHRGHPLGWGRPEEVPQAFRDAFHSAWEEQSDSAPEYVLEDSGDEFDDIVAYDMETSRYTTVVTGNDERKGTDAVPTAGIERNNTMTLIITKRS